MSILQKVLDDKVYNAIDIARNLVKYFPNKEYIFHEREKIQILFNEDSKQANKLIWFEILNRCEMSAVSSIKRQLDWIKLIERSEDNFIGYCSGFRGLIESSGDVSHGLKNVALTIAYDNKLILNCINKNSKQLISHQQLEELLIHFMFASKKNYTKSQIKNLQPKQSTEYVSELDFDGNKKFADEYSFLCEIVHPACGSLLLNYEGVNPLTWRQCDDKALCIEHLEKNSELFNYIYAMGINPGLLILKTLNLFNLPEFQNDFVDNIQMDHIPAWQKIKLHFA